MVWFLVRIPRVSQPLHTFRRLIRCQTRIRHLGWSFESLSLLCSALLYFALLCFSCIFFFFLGRSFCVFGQGHRFLVSSPRSIPSLHETHTDTFAFSWLAACGLSIFTFTFAFTFTFVFNTELNSKHNGGTIFERIFGVSFQLFLGWQFSPRVFGKQNFVNGRRDENKCFGLQFQFKNGKLTDW